MKTSHLTIYILFAVTAAIVLLNRYTEFYLTDYRVHFFFLFNAASSLVIIIGHFFNKLKTGKSILITFAAVGILCFLKAYFTWGGDWKTQTIVYRNIQNANKTIDYQLRADQFSFGYKKRVVEIRQLAPFMQWTSDVDTSGIDLSQWKKIDLNVDGMGLGEEVKK
jgi:hypothetical protein